MWTSTVSWMRAKVISGARVPEGTPDERPGVSSSARLLRASNDDAEFRLKKQDRDLPGGLRPAFNQEADLPEGRPSGPRGAEPPSRRWGYLLASGYPHLPEGRRGRLRPVEALPGRLTRSAVTCRGASPKVDKLGSEEIREVPGDLALGSNRNLPGRGGWTRADRPSSRRSARMDARSGRE